MRDFKFRALHRYKGGEQMLSWKELGKWEFDNAFSLYRACEKDDIHSKDFTLMQYTGLKDKNGKEIYEGDILSVPETGWANIHHATVIFKDGAFLTDFMNDPITDKHEIIGNIYENPELLK